MVLRSDLALPLTDERVPRRDSAGSHSHQDFSHTRRGAAYLVDDDHLRSAKAMNSHCSHFLTSHLFQDVAVAVLESQNMASFISHGKRSRRSPDSRVLYCSRFTRLQNRTGDWPGRRQGQKGQPELSDFPSGAILIASDRKAARFMLAPSVISFPRHSCQVQKEPLRWPPLPFTIF